MDSTNKSTELTPKIPDLPQELITEILLRLPVKSLLKFKSVCKQWLISITSSQFIKTHVNFSRKPKNHANCTLILVTRNIPTTYYTCSISSILCNNVMDDSRFLDFPMTDPDFQLWFVGSCDGLLCVSVDPTTLVLYNPSTRKSKSLPVSGTNVGASSYISYGFCYDELYDDYKVVELNVVRGNRGEFMYHTEVKVYSLRNDAWRRMEDDYDGRICSSGGECVGGILHWRIATATGTYLIFAVNIATNACSVLAPPGDDGIDGFGDWSPGELNGCLCIFHDSYKVRLDVWAMKEYGVVESWSKVASIAYPANPRGHLWPLFVLEDGEIFLDYEPYLMIGNSGNNSVTTREIHTAGGLCTVGAPAYIESLVDPSFV